MSVIHFPIITYTQRKYEIISSLCLSYPNAATIVGIVEQNK